MGNLRQSYQEKETVRPVQLPLFPWRVIQFAKLKAINHPRPVYYDLWLEEFLGSYRVRKESGIEGRRPNRWLWPYPTLADAEKKFDQKIRDKTNLNRRSPRKYAVAASEPSPESD
jgi:hypothetical protein